MGNENDIRLELLEDLGSQIKHSRLNKTNRQSLSDAEQSNGILNNSEDIATDLFILTQTSGKLQRGNFYSRETVEEASSVVRQTVYKAIEEMGGEPSRSIPSMKLGEEHTENGEDRGLISRSGNSTI